MWEKKQIAVVGVGSVGGYFGGLLANAGLNVTFLARNETFEALKKFGLKIESSKKSFTINPVKVENNSVTVGPVDIVLIGVKSHQIDSVIDTIKPLIKEDTIILPLQNGIDAPLQLEKVFGDHVIGGVCRTLCRKISPATVKHDSVSIIEFGELKTEITPRVTELKSILEYAGISAIPFNDFREAQWAKMMIVCPLSGVTSVTRSTIGQIRSIPETREMLITAIEEIFRLTIRLGINLNEKMPAYVLKSIDRLPDDITTSMQRDIMDGRPSELHFQVGTVVKIAEELGVYAPLNKYLYHTLIPFELKARNEIN